MANEEQLSILKQGVDAWNSWRASDYSPEIDLTRGPHLSHAKLGNVDLRHADLSYAILRSANLRGVNLDGARLNGTDLSDADLSEAKLRTTDIRLLQSLETFGSKALILDLLI